MDTTAFIQWFKQNAEALKQKDSETATNELLVELQKIDERLAAEVGEEGDARELVLSAQGDSELFEPLEELARRLGPAEGWVIHPLKPARGFEFKLDANGELVDGRVLYFEPLESPSMPGILGLRLFAPERMVPPLTELAWWVIETGIGEKSAALIEHLEVAAMPEDKGELMPIRALANFVSWHTHRKQNVVRS